MAHDVSGATKSEAHALIRRWERIPLTRHHWRWMGLLGIGTFFDAYDTLAIAGAMTAMFATLHLSLAGAGLLGGMAYLGEFFGAFLFGWLSERVGRKRAFLLALVLFGLVSLATAFARSVSALLWLRGIQGLGLGGEVPIAAALVNEFFQARVRGQWVMVYESSFTWGIFLAPLISAAAFALAGPANGWRWIFAIGCIPALWAIPVALGVPESVRWLVDHGQLATASTIVQRTEQQAQREGKALPPPVERIEADVAPSRLGELFGPQYRRRTALVWLLWFLTYFVSNGFNVWLPSLYVRLGHLSRTESLLLTAVGGAWTVGLSYVAAFLIERWGRKRLFATGYAVMMLGALVGALEIWVGHVHAWVALFVVELILITGYAPLALGLYTYTPELYPTRIRGWGTAVGTGWNRIASFVAPVVIGALLDSGAGLGTVFLLWLAAAALGLLTIWGLGVETRGQVLEELSP